MRENPFAGFLTKRGFELRGIFYHKEGLDHKYELASNDRYYILKCHFDDPGVLEYPSGTMLDHYTHKAWVFSDESMEMALVARGMKFYPDQEMNLT
jgi:hypothetical protein